MQTDRQRIERPGAAPPGPPDPGGEVRGAPRPDGTRPPNPAGTEVRGAPSQQGSLIAGSGVLPPGIGGAGGGRPLLGRRILVTRARAQAGELSHALAELGAIPVELPAIR